MNTAEVLSLYLAGALPRDITVVSLPMRLMAYGDLQVVSKYRAFAPNHVHSDSFAAIEDILIEQFARNGEDYFAGYGPNSKILALVTFTEVPNPGDMGFGNKVTITLNPVSPNTGQEGEG